MLLGEKSVGLSDLDEGLSWCTYLCYQSDRLNLILWTCNNTTFEPTWSLVKFTNMPTLTCPGVLFMRNLKGYIHSSDKTVYLLRKKWVY